MEVACLAAGAFFSVAQVLLARKMFNIQTKPGMSALYIFQWLILSLGLLVAVFFIYQPGLLYTTAGLVGTSVIMALVYNLKR